jgi:hypothetical protein
MLQGSAREIRGPRTDSKLNDWGLLNSLRDCCDYCELADREMPQDAPWYPVAVCLDKGTFRRLVGEVLPR